MFNEEFFPTPNSVISKMIRPFASNIKEMAILEPSAGKGNILDYIKTSYHSYGKFTPYCIEPNKELQYILQEKGYKLIAEDFLDYHGDYYFDLIIMNPPFSNGDKHLLKAWDVLKGGDIVCLLNEETLLNPHTESRKHLLSIIQEHGEVEYLGDCFKSSERKTRVNVVMVKLKKKQANDDKLNFEFESVTSEAGININEETLKDRVALNDKLGNMIAQYDTLKKHFIDYMKAEEALSFYSQGLLRDNEDIIKIAQSERGNSKHRFNGFCDDVKQGVWNVVINKLGMERYMTHKVRENFSKFTEQQGAMDFTKENVFNLFKTLMLNGESILEQAIIDVFDLVTKHHKENRYLIEGWKTNDKWKVNRRIILPYYVTGGFNSYYRTDYHRYSEYTDIDKVMCYLTGKTFEKVLKIQDAIPTVRYGDSSLHRSEFFNFRCYKKGTLHLEFKDVELWKEFNLRACAGKHWLPEAERKEYESRKKDNGYQLLQLSA